MKQFNKYFSFRPLQKIAGLVIAAMFISAIAICAVEDYNAKTSAGIEAVQHENNSDRALVVVLAMVAIPAIHSLRLTTSLGLQWTRTEETLIEFLRGPRADKGAAEKYLSREYRFRDYGLYRSLLIDGMNGIQKVWDSTVSKAIGITNVDRARLDKDITICIDTILVGYANSGGAGTDPSNIAGYDHVVTGWVAGLVNAEISIYQDGNPLIDDLPLRLCGSMADSTFGVGRAEGYLLKNPIILEGDKPFEVRVNFPQSIAATNTDFLRIDLLGVGTRKRGMI